MSDRVNDVNDEIDEAIYKYNCEKCDFHGNHKHKFEMHCLSNKHKENHDIDDEDEEHKYNCISCDYHTHTKSHFTRHCNTDKHFTNVKIKKNDKIEYKFNCDNCDFHTNYQYKYDEHCKTKEHGIKIKIYEFNCEPCDYHSDNQQSYNKHCRRPTHKKNCEDDEEKEEKPQIKLKYNCRPCDYHNDTKSNYDKHCYTKKHKQNIKEHGEEQIELKYNCKPCDYHNDKKCNYVRHLVTMKHKNNIEKEVKEESKNEYKYNCEKCNFHSGDISAYNRHLLSDKHKKNYGIIIKDKEHKCINCNYSTDFLANYNNHLQTDKHKIIHGIKLTIKKYRCNDCGCSFHSKYSYKLHLQTFKHLLTTEEYKILKQNMGKRTIKIGDECEKFIRDIYKESKQIENVESIGQTGNTFDIVINFIEDPDIIRGIQVKHLTYKSRDKSYNLDIRKGQYPKNTLIVGMNTKDKIFCLFHVEEVKVKYISIRPKSKSTIYKKFIYTLDKFEQFKLDLIEKSKKSVKIKDIKDYLSKTNLQEYESLERFQIKCKENKLKYEQSETTDDIVDCYVNKKKVQHKSSDNLVWSKYEFAVKRTGKNIPYSENDDIDLFIFEITNDTYKNNFFIIPKQILIDKGIISTEEQSGKTRLKFPLKNLWDNENNHWTLEYLNKFDLFE
jgi:hypothetical protein